MMKTFAYQGFRCADSTTRVVALSANGEALYDLPLRLDLADHSPTGFDWGYNGSGPAQLALAILADKCAHRDFPDEVRRLGDTMALEAHQNFKDRVVARLAHDGWVIIVSDLTGYIENTTGAVAWARLLGASPAPAPADEGHRRSETRMVLVTRTICNAMNPGDDYGHCGYPECMCHLEDHKWTPETLAEAVLALGEA